MTRKKNALRESTTTPPQMVQPVQTPQQSFPIVGIGASAGGLTAFEAFFSGMPADTDPGMAFVLVQHLAPDHKSILTELIRRHTRMQVFEVEEGMKVTINSIYIIPPNRDLAYLNGRLHLMEPTVPRGQRLPIDFFFRSLAQDQQERAICIVLSGAGSDGTQGVRAIKGKGGMVMVQSLASAEHDGMPRSALATGMVDFELPPAAMAARLITYAVHAFGGKALTAAVPEVETDHALQKIFILLRDQTGHDFSSYKPSTIYRRIKRRMALHQIETIDKYIKFLQHSPNEVEELFRDILIRVTNFFRNPDAFKVLEKQAIPQLFAGKTGGAAIRVWVPGCSTGEEAYSIAILLQEYQETLREHFEMQIFATDIDNQAIAIARTGLYPAGIALDITPERLARFFTLEADGSYQVHKNTRDLLVFSEQDVTRDPPFSRIDLISCRNLFIYFIGDLQKRLIHLFHYALNPKGFLFLGKSETVGDPGGDLFVVRHRQSRLYQHKNDVRGVHRLNPSKFLSSMTKNPVVHSQAISKDHFPRQQQVRELTEQTILQHVAPVCTLVNEQGNILYIHGRTGMYLEPASGEAGVNNILKMAREGLRHKLTTSLQKVVEGKKTERCPDLLVKTNGDFTVVNLTIRPVLVGTATDEEFLYLVILDEATPPMNHEQLRQAARHTFGDQDSASAGIEALVETLRQELQVKEEYLQTSNKELKSANEELRSVNEELQSTNEEMETSREELQSINEELTTVNAELQNKVRELSSVNNDMNSLLAGLGIATILVDHQLRIQRFTPAATRIINLIAGDAGRPVGHIVSNLIDYQDLIADTQTVLDTLIPLEKEVQTTDGTWNHLRIWPYRTTENIIEGAVITFVDCTAAKKAQEALRLNEERMRVALQTVPIVIANQDKELRYTWICKDAPFSASRMLGKTDADFLPPDEAANTMAIKQRVLDSGIGARHNVEMTIDGIPHSYDLLAEPLRDTDGTSIGITCAMLARSDHWPGNQPENKNINQ